LTIVLPAEYGIGPVADGTQARPGCPLERVRTAAETRDHAGDRTAQKAAIPERAFHHPVLGAVTTGDAPTVKDAFIHERRGFHFDSREITLAPGEGMEIKYNMRKGAGLLYSWTQTHAVL